MSVVEAAQPVVLRYLVSGRGSDGGRLIERLEAESGAEAVGQAEARGWSDVLLHQDEATALTMALARREAEVEGGKPTPLAPPEAEYAQRFSAPQAWQAAVERWTRIKGGAIVPTIAVQIALYALGLSWWLIIPAAIVVFLVFTAGGSVRPVVAYQEMKRAFIARDPVRARIWLARMVEALDRLGLRSAVGSIEILSSRAQTYAQEGDIDRAIETMAPIRTRLGAPEWLYQSRLSSMLDGANEDERALAAAEEAARLGPKCRTLWADVAFKRAVVREDAAGAREAWNTALTAPESEGFRIVGHVMEGAVLLAEGRHVEAANVLEPPVAQHDPILLGPFETLRKALYAEALAARGDEAEALELAAQALLELQAMRERHISLRMERLIERLSQ